MIKPGSKLRDKAIRLLAQREQSRAELARRLAQHGPEAEVQALLDELAVLGLQSDQRFAHAWVRAKAGRFGLARLRHDLAQRGIDRMLIDAAIDAEMGGDETTRARAVWASRFGELPGDRSEWARQARFLQGRGFATTTIVQVLKEGADESA